MISIIISFLMIIYTQISHPKAIKSLRKPIAVHKMSLENRYNNTFVNGVFKSNILLTIHNTSNKINSNVIDWKKILQPSQFQLVLKPGETFAFHDDVLPQYQGKVGKTTNSHFNSSEGFISDGYLVGDGVCHLASLLYWVAKDAGLKTEAPTRHDFAPIPEVPREFGVSIYNYPGKSASNELQNLYISNTKDKTVTFQFNYDGKDLTILALN